MTTAEPVRRRVTLTGISSRSWEHPSDRGALVALSRLRGFDALLRTMSGFFSERVVRMSLLGSCVRVSPRQFPHLHALYADTARVLDVPQLPDLYVRAAPTFNAMTIGVDAPMVVIDSGLLDLLDDDELRFVLGHELGHALSGHALYRTMLLWLLTFGVKFAGGIPMGLWGARALIAGLNEWARKAELSSDRAGLLATQDPTAGMRTLMKIASGGHLDDLDTTEFLDQAREYDATTDVRDSMIKLMMLETATHPFTVVRAGELNRWATSGAYAKILAGDYLRREQEDDLKLTEEAKAAADAYAEDFRRSEDVLTRLFTDIAEGVGGVASSIGAKLFGRN